MFLSVGALFIIVLSIHLAELPLCLILNNPIHFLSQYILLHNSLHIPFVIQIMQGVNGLYNDSNKERKEAFARLEQLRKKGTVTDDDVELASYREDKYGR